MPICVEKVLRCDSQESIHLNKIERAGEPKENEHGQ